MAYDFNLTRVKQINDIGIPALCLLGCKEAPITVTDRSKIARSNPSDLFAWVSSFGPGPEVFEDAGINVAEGFLGTRMAMIVGPSPDNRIELPGAYPPHSFHAIL